MNEKEFITNYFKKCSDLLVRSNMVEDIINAKEIILKTKNNGGKIIFAGNGASASIANHASLDFTKQGKVNSVNFNESAFITAFSNDYGYENWVQRAVKFYGKKEDTIILISSSGSSKNIVEALLDAKNNLGIISIGMGGNRDSEMRNICDYYISL